MGDERTPYLRFYAVLCVRIEKVQLKILFYFFEQRFYSPSVFINQGDFFRRDIPIVGDEFVFPSLFVPIVNQSEAKGLFLFLLFIFQVNVLNPVHPMFIFDKQFLIKGFLNFGFRVIFQPAHKIDPFICPLCKLHVIVVRLVEDQYTAFWGVEML